MEICPKQQDTALNSLIKTLKFSHTRTLLLPASWSWRLSIFSSHSSLAQGQPGPLPGSGIEEQPPLCSLSTSSSLKTWSLKIKAVKLGDFLRLKIKNFIFI